MRRMLFKSLVHGPLTEAAPEVDEATLAELAGQVDRAARLRLGRTLFIREVDAGSCNGCELEIHALRRLTAARRCPAGDRTGDDEHARSARAHVPGDARPEMGGRRRRLCARRGHLCGELRVCWRRIRGSAGRSAHPRLPAFADRAPPRAAGVTRNGAAERKGEPLNFKKRICPTMESDCA